MNFSNASLLCFKKAGKRVCTLIRSVDRAVKLTWFRNPNTRSDAEHDVVRCWWKAAGEDGLRTLTVQCTTLAYERSFVCQWSFDRCGTVSSHEANSRSLDVSARSVDGLDMLSFRHPCLNVQLHAHCTRGCLSYHRNGSKVRLRTHILHGRFTITRLWTRQPGNTWATYDFTGSRRLVSSNVTYPYDIGTHSSLLHIADQQFLPPDTRNSSLVLEEA